MENYKNYYILKLTITASIENILALLQKKISKNTLRYRSKRHFTASSSTTRKLKITATPCILLREFQIVMLISKSAVRFYTSATSSLLQRDTRCASYTHTRTHKRRVIHAFPHKRSWIYFIGVSVSYQNYRKWCLCKHLSNQRLHCGFMNCNYSVAGYGQLTVTWNNIDWTLN